MTLHDAVPPTAGEEPARLLFGLTLGQAFATLFDLPGMFAKAAILPFILGLFFAIVGLLLSSAGTLVSLAWQIAGILPLALLTVAYSRLSLLGRDAGALPRPLLGRRTWGCFGYILLMGLIALVPAVVLILLAFADQVTMPPGAEQLPEVVGRRVLIAIPALLLTYLVTFYLVARLSLVFPALAVDRKLGLGSSWRLTRGGNGFRLYAALLVISITCMAGVFFLTITLGGLVGFFLSFLGALPGSAEQVNLLAILALAVPLYLFVMALNYLVFALMLAVLAAAYAQLSGWRGGVQDLPARFE
ncbi:MAG: hypothetical protein Kow00114_32490 [Kiloniellaceae bacterium]